MRGSLVLVAVFAALVAVVPASADLRPIRRDFGEIQIPRVRTGTVTIPRGHARGRVTVIVRLQQPPLARYARTLQGRSHAARLNVRSASSRAYLARLDAAQRAATAQLRRAIPEAKVARRYRIVLNGLAVELPVTRLPELVRQRFATKVYPSLRYRLALNESPSLIGSAELGAATGARGDGMKIAVVDDGVDQSNPFFRPEGYQMPAGYPRGGTRWTNAKVIVARSFPGPGSGRRGRLAVDPRASFHGTHVAGIAAGNAGTTAPAGEDHPTTPGLTGVAPRAYIGNYRVFTVPTPIGNVANTPEIVAAFEAAVSDGMDVINFSGGGPETEPVNDAMNETVANVAAAGVVAVISAGNDREEFGLGSAGSPGTAPEAISVAAVSNDQVFGPALVVEGAGGAQLVPYRSASNLPNQWGAQQQTLHDVGTIVGTNGQPVDRKLCGPPGNVNGGPNPLPPNSLRGELALVSRGTCSFVSKIQRAARAGAIGVVVADNRPGEANPIPLRVTPPLLMIADVDAARLRALMAAQGGRIGVRVDEDPLRIETNRGGVVTSFSSAGPTAFGHLLKPDVAAPGGQILSSTLRIAGGPFAVFDGTSMSAPHVAGAAALLLQRHPAWSPRQLKSALVATAGPAWADTARTVEAPVLLQGGGLVDVRRADDPRIFTAPATLSFGDQNVNRGAQREAQLLRIEDAGGGAGTWQVELRPQAASTGATLELPAVIEVPPGGAVEVPVAARAAADAPEGENYGFVVLRRGDVTRRIPYLFIVNRPTLESVPVRQLRDFQLGDTLRGGSRVDAYGYPAAPFGPPPDYVGPPMQQVGAEKLYVTQIRQPVANFGVSILVSSPGSLIDPWVLGSRDERDVQGFAGTPVNVNPLTFGYGFDIGAAGASMPRPKTYYISVDSGRDPFTGRSLAGRYVLQSWVNDVSPPVILPVTTRVAAGRPTLVARVFDGVFEQGSGVDPLSLVVAYGRVLIGAAAYDPLSGYAVFPIPRAAPPLRTGQRLSIFVASDYQEAKNVNTSGEDIMPNTSFRVVGLRVLNRPTVTWLAPEVFGCVRGRTSLAVVASSTARIRSVRFSDGGRRIATVRRGDAGLYGTTWRARGRGRHTLRATVVDARGRTATATRTVRVCR